MNEYEISIKLVLPYLRDHLSWPQELISSYGRVPVQIGSTIRWADFVCYITKDEKPTPWLLVEVKQPNIPLDQALPQAESYSLILGAPFLCVTNGNDFDFYMTGDSQGKSINISCPPPAPTLDYLQIGVQFISFPQSLDNLIELFIIGLKEEAKFFEDTKGHHESCLQLNKIVFKRLNNLSPKEFKDAIDNFLMIKPPNKNHVFKQIDVGFDKVRKVLYFLNDFSGDPLINIKRLLDKNDSLYIKGGGIFFITQLLAGAHPDEYIILEERVSKTLKNLGITDVMVYNDTPNGYIFVNEICKKLYREKLQKKLKLKGFDFGLAAVHNFLWHYDRFYFSTKKWFP